MFRRFIGLLLVVGSMALIVYADPFGLPEGLSPTLVLGFMLLAAYCIGFILEQYGLPRITGYIFAGLFLGPYFLNFIRKEAVESLGFLNSLALAFIAFCAGGELKLGHLRNKLKSIAFLVIGQTVLVFSGVTLVVFIISGFIPFMSGFDTVSKIAVSAIFGVISVSLSPASTIAIISETKAEGDYTDTVLGVTIAADVVILIFYAVVIAASEVLIAGKGTFSLVFILGLVLEIVIAFLLGFLLGKAIIFLIEKVKVEFPVVITIMGFLVIKFSQFLGEYLYDIHKIHLNLEPILICMAAGFTVQNFSKHGTTFLDRMDNVSLPIYIGFFAITGASINVDVLKTAWFLGLLIALFRTLMLYVGSHVSGRLSGDPPVIYKNTWLGFITQAGVSLGLLAEVVRRLPEVGTAIQTILIATITLNQLIGPVAFKYALFRAGEIKAKKK